jgi:hypothetical protein
MYNIETWSIKTIIKKENKNNKKGKTIIKTIIKKENKNNKTNAKK